MELKIDSVKMHACLKFISSSDEIWIPGSKLCHCMYSLQMSHEKAKVIKLKSLFKRYYKPTHKTRNEALQLAI